MSHSILLKELNDFIEDTAVIVATAYLLGRGNQLNTVFRQDRSLRDSIKLGLILGMVACTEVIFPEERYPYLTDTLTTGFATLAGGPVAGIVSAALVTLSTLLLRPDMWAVRTVCMFVTVLICGVYGRLMRPKQGSGVAFGGGLVSQSIVLLVTHWLWPRTLEGMIWHGLGAVLGNAAGMAMTTTVFQEAWVRANSERNRLIAEQSKALAAEAQLAALRARVHPHFLFNALTAISGLCGIDSDEAAELTAQLGDLMRRTLESSASTTIPLHRELEYVRVYLAIEQRRYAERLCVVWSVDEDCANVAVPPFALQTLVENAVRHGVGRVNRPVTVWIRVRRRGSLVQVGVVDNGVGISSKERCAALSTEVAHGLSLVDSQLTLIFGKRARLRLFGAAGRGTIAAFTTPWREVIAYPNGTGAP